MPSGVREERPTLPLRQVGPTNKREGPETKKKKYIYRKGINTKNDALPHLVLAGLQRFLGLLFHFFSPPSCPFKLSDLGLSERSYRQ